MVAEKARAQSARRASGLRGAPPPVLRSSGLRSSSLAEDATSSASAVSATPSCASATPSASIISEADGEAAEKHDARPMTVGVRVRPLSTREKNNKARSVLTVTDGSKVFASDPDEKMGGRDYLRLDKTKDHAYRFDNAFGPEASSLDIYRACLQPVVRAVGQGYHGSCFAYGATGSGKTYTMMGESAAPGVMPMAVQELFELSAKEDDYNWSFALTYVEIYNERVKDLLAPETGHDLDVREDARRGTHIQGALEVSVGSLHELLEYMQQGAVYRTTEATNCNAVSSRSHEPKP